MEHQAKQTSKVLLYVLSNQTRNVVSMMEIAYMAGSSIHRGHKLVVVLEHYPESGVTVNLGETLSTTELDNLESGVITVHDLIERQVLLKPGFKTIAKQSLKSINPFLFICHWSMIRDNLARRTKGPKSYEYAKMMDIICWT